MAIAFFSTWTTYGTWLPGDERGWFERGRFWSPDLMRKFAASLRMTEGAITLDVDQRRLVEATIAEHCVHRAWTLHAVNCRSNHVHAVVTAPGREIDIPREQFKTWCTRKLSDRAVADGSPNRKNWWTQRGWDDFVDDMEFLGNAIAYVRDGQGHAS